MFIIGLYGVTREVMTTTFSWLSVLSELAMPFYLTHQQILVVIVAGASWYPHLSESLMKCQLSTSPLPLAIFAGSFPVVLILSTVGTLVVSWSITKAGPLRYFFGLPTKHSALPGNLLHGFVPTAVMSLLFVVGCVLAHHL